MNSRTPAPGTAAPDRPDGAVDPSRLPTPGDRVGWAEAPARIRVALGLAAGAAALQVVGWVLGPVADAPPPGFTALPLLVLLALLPPVLAAVAFARGRALFGASVLVGAAALLPGRLLLDAQFLVDPLYASRPEVTVVHSLQPLSAGAGLWPLLLGHVLGLVAGALAFGHRSAEVGTPYAAEFEDPATERAEDPGAERVEAPHSRPMAALVLGGLAGVALLARPYTSDNPFQLADGAMGGRVLPGVGLFALAVLLPLAAVFAATSGYRSVVAGVPTGLLAGVAAVAAPNVAAGLFADGLHVAPGPVVALLFATATLVVAWGVAAGRRLPDSSAKTFDAPATGGLGLHRAAGAVGLVTVAFALIAYLGRQLVLPPELPEPVEYSNRLFLPGALGLAVLSAALLVPALAAAARPAFTVALAVVPLAGVAALDSAVTATEASPLISAGTGALAAGSAIAAALVAAVLAAVAGSAERDDAQDGGGAVDPAGRQVNPVLAAPAAAAALFAVGAFGLPALRAPDFVSPGIWADFRLTSWGLLTALAAVLAATALALFSRPARGAALLLGAALLVGVRALEYPLTAARAEGATPGPGTWLALAAAAALLVAAAVAAAAKPHRRRR
ncbi:hypothetical protein L6E12_24765 [Actinokineospora sp. PR83]|uniref:hypothetical protein n=1 Tax=Actinokineospora sp. PR83 TaxID=2884908 RepID=UPI001F1AFD8B|nr:hypothetical protein [Actinokineospora sp. PR83]MCG8918998.1 hypothetical protein [Actinokineospora sp. PR83]